MICCSGFETTLALKGLETGFWVGAYGVDVDGFDKALALEFESNSTGLVIIDEIGRMELLSARFRKLVERLWESDEVVVATIMQASDAFCDKLKSHPSSELARLSFGNRNSIMEKIRNITGIRHVV